MVCPECNGEKEIFGLPGRIPASIPCDRCKCSGVVDDIQAYWMTLGKTKKDWRIYSRRTLREEAKLLGIDPCLLSQAERGAIDPRRVWPGIAGTI